MKKNILYSIGIVLFYLLLVFLLKNKIIIFPVFMIIAFLLSMFLSLKQVIYSFSLLTIIFISSLFSSTTVVSTTIIYIVFIPLSFLLGYYLKKKHKLLKLLFIVFLIIFPQYAFNNLWSITHNYKARQITDLPKMEVLSENEELLRLDSVKNKIIVLDYWTTNCGVCFKGFPKYQEIYSLYKDNPNVELYALNIPIKRDTIGQAKKMISKYNYKFPVLYATSDSLSKAMGINKYPHLVIIKDGKIRFNGAIIMDDKIKFYHLKNEIDLLLKE